MHIIVQLYDGIESEVTMLHCIQLTNCPNEQIVLRPSDGDGLAIDLRQEFNRQCVFDVLHRQGFADVRRAVSDENFDHRPVVVGIARVFMIGNVLAEPIAVDVIIVVAFAVDDSALLRRETTDATGNVLFVLPIVVVAVDENDAGEDHHGEGNGAGNLEHHDRICSSRKTRKVM